MMTASNLAICVGPSLLWSEDPNNTDQKYYKEVSALVQILIEEYPKLFDKYLPELFEKKEANGEGPESVVGATPLERTVSNSSSTRKDSDSGQPRDKQSKSK